MPRLFHHTLTRTAQSELNEPALLFKEQSLNYAELIEQCQLMAKHFVSLGIKKNTRIAIYLPKQFETVISFYASSMSGGIFVPINPLLKPAQVSFIMQDCDVELLITSSARLNQLQSIFSTLPNLKTIVLVDAATDTQKIELAQQSKNMVVWLDLIKQANDASLPTLISQDVAAILYTSGSTGNPKGVVLSHKNLVAGANSVAEYLRNNARDRLLAVLPFSFDYGLSQITTAFLRGASVVLMEYLLPRDVVKAVAKYKVTGLAAVPPLWVQLAALEWPDEAVDSLRYFTNSGGAMPTSTLSQLREKLHTSQPFLMYGLTEAFRSTYLDPSEIDQRPTSMGKAIPDAEILVLNAEGDLCEAGEKGELVHRGPHVALGYWNAPEKTAERFKPLPKSLCDGIHPEIAVWSGDTVLKDEQGFLYFVGRKDDMIKSSSYRISPSEIEDIVYQYEGIIEVSAIGVPHQTLGQAIVLVIQTESGFDESKLLKFCLKQMPNFMQPKAVKLVNQLPRNPNGKINRKKLAEDYSELFE